MAVPGLCSFLRETLRKHYRVIEVDQDVTLDLDTNAGSHRL